MTNEILNKPFDINEYVQSHSIEKSSLAINTSNKLTFTELVEHITKRLNEKWDDHTLTDEQLSKRQTLQHNATIGVEYAEFELKDEIEMLLREDNLLGIKYPDFYDNLAHGVFQEIYRFGMFYKWEKYLDSPSAKIIGDEIWFKINGVFIRQEERLRSKQQIYEIIRLLQIGNSSFKVNESKPQDEIVLQNGVRIKVIIPPLSNNPTIVFRRFIVSKFSFQKQAGLETIPYEDISFHETLSKLYLNSNIGGAVESAKSTFLKTIYGARDPEKVCILIEPNPESFLKRDFPDRLVHELYTDKNSDPHSTQRDVLRIDHDFIIHQEVRGIEANSAIDSMERGTRGTLFTYHITNPYRMIEQLAQHITDEFPNRKIVNEIRRIAQQLDIGYIMKSFPNNKKKFTDLYEVCYSHEEDKAWINYLIRYDKKSNMWLYNADVSEQLQEKMYEYSEEDANYVMEHLRTRSELYPLRSNTKQMIHFKE